MSDLLNDIDIEDFLEALGVDFKKTTGRKGVQLNIKECPRCHGNKRKVFLNAETGLGNCFHGSCVGEPGFNLFTFTSALLGSNKAASQEISQYKRAMGWQPKSRVKLERGKSNIALSYEGVKLPDSLALPHGEQNAQYLANRGFTNETTKYFNWRLCVQGSFSYKDHYGNSKWQSYDGRIIVPVFDLDGDLKTFQGRDITGTSEKKYLFPPGLAGTSAFLYNGHNAKGAKHIVIGEGAFDVSAIHQAFQVDDYLKEVVPVGTFGKNISIGQNSEDQLGQLLILKRFGLKIITMMWDSEPKTISDMCRVATDLKRYGFEVRISILPKGKDPNEASPLEVRKAFRSAFPATAANLVSCQLSRFQP